MNNSMLASSFFYSLSKTQILSLLLVLIFGQMIVTADDLSTVNGILASPRTKFFRVSRDNSGKWSAANPDSYYAGDINSPKTVFTVGNGSGIAAISPDGTLQALCRFGETERHPSPYAGGWVSWKRYIYGPVTFKIETAGNSVSPARDWPCQTSYLLNALPITEYQSAHIKITVITCPPISADGRERPRGLIWGICLQNVSTTPVKGVLNLTIPDQLLLKDTATQQEFNLAAGAEAWFPLVLAKPDDAATLAKRDATSWVQESCAYWQRVTGQFTMTGDPFTAELFTRLTVASLESGALDSKGETAGVLYGTYPFEGADNFKDSYYAIIAAAQRDPLLLQTFIPWFAHYAVRPVETKYPGGITNSLGNSLNSVLLAGLYYESTGDRDYFTSHPKLVKTLTDILEQVLATRKDPGPWLFPSSYVSDGKSTGDYHTGSNVCAWRAFKSFARILDEACGDKQTAARDHAIAAHIKKDLDKHNILDGPFGPQYMEGTDADGTVPAMIHDGEESDTTLMPFYGYCALDFAPYRNFMRFAVSTHNGSFNPDTRGIVWENYGPGAKVQPAGGLNAEATFPGFITALASCTDAESLSGNDGYRSEIRRLTDVTGMWWWWPYDKESKRGQVRRFPFECGWAEGEFAVFYPRNFLGLSYDAPTQTLRFSPPPTTGDFTWTHFSMGFDTFNLSYQQGRAIFKNSSSHPVTLIAGVSPPVRIAAGGSSAAILAR